MDEIKKIFITGGAGYVGAMLAPSLISKGYELTIYDLMIYGENVITDNPKIKKLHCSMFSSHFNNTYEKWGFRLRPSDTENKLFIDVKNLKSEVLDNNTIYYDYDVLKKTISHKLNVLAFVNTDNKTVDDEEHFHFTDCKIFYKCNFDKFISLISNDKIMYDIRIGSYKTGSNFGKVHDHGSGFRVKREDMRLVFSSVYDVE